MRTLSKKTQYILRALYHLAGKYPQGPVLISRLSREETIPLKFLQQILLQLKKERLVDSRMGRGGPSLRRLYTRDAGGCGGRATPRVSAASFYNHS
jgi:DNA-binding IscR family transcriptional regulator